MTLVEHYGREPISIRQLAERNAVPNRFLEHTMLDLKSQGWVTSLPGKSGGYVLSRRPDEIRMGQVVRYFDGLLARSIVFRLTSTSNAARNLSAVAAVFFWMSAMRPPV
jgi:Rrf2 family protein